MTRKDFNLIAETIRDLGDPSYTQATATAFAVRLRASHPRFDPERFLLACGVPAYYAPTLAQHVEARAPIFA